MRDTLFAVRLTDDERGLLAGAAALKGITPSELARRGIELAAAEVLATLRPAAEMVAS